MAKFGKVAPRVSGTTSFRNPATGKFIGINARGEVVWSDEEQMFEVVTVNGQTGYRAKNGKFLSLGADCVVRATVDAVGAQELFTVCESKTGGVSIQAANGQFLSGTSGVVEASPTSFEAASIVQAFAARPREHQ
jgi:hypothetical protein